VVALSIEQVLNEEAHAMRGAARAEPRFAQSASGQEAQTERIRKNADQRDGKDLPPEEVERRKVFYRSFNKLKRAALCCSGGGIRSATFCLGVIQALADYDATSAVPTMGNNPAAGGAAAQDTNTPPARHRISEAASPRPENSLLGHFHYLSTVSGGGYVGSWLSSWRTRDDFPSVIRNLIGRPDGGDVEPPEITWLRAYSNFLTPRIGVASADAWAAVAIIVRNLILNWLIIIPVVCLVLLALKIVATVSVWIAESDDTGRLIILTGIAGAIALVVAQAFATRLRPARRAPHDNVNQLRFLARDLIWAVFSAIAITVFLSSHYFVKSVDFSSKTQVLAPAAVAGLLIFSVGWIAGFPVRRDWRDFARWAASGLVYGALAGLGAYLYHLLQASQSALALPDRYASLLVPIIWGVPWMLMAQLAAESVFVGLASYETDSDADREWLGRSAGWLAVVAVAWALTAFLVFAGDYAVQFSYISIKHLVTVGGLTGLATALLGKTSRTPAKEGDDSQGITGTVFKIALAVAGPIFAGALIIALSVALDRLLLGDSLVVLLRSKEPPPIAQILPWLLMGLGIAAAVAALASYWVNINRFSLHALYRNRLIRGYLGASRQARDPDQFTGFDSKDNIRAQELWPPRARDGTNSWSLFHVINITLNVVSTKRLAWQERKAEPFTVSPLHCGSAYLGYRPSGDYGDYPGKGGISLGTAMAISGAAVSSNMGYSSSPSVTLLLSLFNVRLGWWLGNPGVAGDTSYQTDGPRFAVKPLLTEAFGLTTDERPYVNLSDGGHFEDLGLYEMVRRRCRFIVVIDAGQDADFTFEDLGNAVRKIYIDLGIRIRFEGLEVLRNRPPEKVIRREAGGVAEQPHVTIPYHAVGAIDYACVDGSEPGCENGFILYIKPAYHGTEGAGIKSYAAAHPTFPHESTADQWFTESQFESYRSLGLDIANDILDRSGEIVLRAQPRKTLRDVIGALENTFQH
jgi:hypothetical protein